MLKLYPGCRRGYPPVVEKVVEHPVLSDNLTAKKVLPHCSDCKTALFPFVLGVYKVAQQYKQQLSLLFPTREKS